MNKVPLTLAIPYELDARLEAMAKCGDTSKSEIFRKMFALFDVVVEAINQGNRVGILDVDGNVITEIVGII